MQHFSIRIFLKLLFLLSIAFLLASNLFAQSIEGYVFIDRNHNSIMDPDESGLKEVMVSNQKDVIITDEKGHFEIKLIKGNFIFITKPEGYQFKLDEYNNPEFYFLYRKKRIKENLKYSNDKISTEIPKLLYFPVYENLGEEAHNCLLVGDPQMGDEKELGFYKEGIIPLMAAKNADFYIELGDITNNNLKILALEKQASETLGIPGYRVFGNHDINYLASNNRYASESFKMVFGPDYYSFDYGSFHYIVLNNVIYEGYQKELYSVGEYYGGLTMSQKKWLVNDLEQVPSEKTIVLLSHIPMHKNFVLKNDVKALFRALKNHKKILAVSGHLHTIIAYDYTSNNGWKGGLGFEGLVAGAACGSWWTGALNENNIPYSVCADGSPKGFFQLSTNEVNYNYTFHAADPPFDLQMRTYVNNDEIGLNWFVGKRTDSVWMFIDDNPQAISMHNFTGKDIHINATSETAHLWKAKLPEGLRTGNHLIKVMAKDSKGKLFNKSFSFYLKGK